MDLLRSQDALFSVILQTTRKIADSPVEQWTAGLVESRLDLLERYWSIFCDNHVQLLGAEDEPVREYLQGGNYSTAEDSYVLARGQLLDHQGRFLSGSGNVSVGVPLASSTITSKAPSTSEDESAINVSLARLPRLTIPRFSGLPQDWESFRDIFVNLVHDNTALKDATKLLFLKTHVDGPAAEALHQFKPIDHDYAPAWEALKCRYDEPKLRKQDHLEALMSLPPLQEESHSALQTLLDKIRRHRNLLNALERPVSHWDDWFVYLTCKAMDKVTQRAWEEELGEEERVKGKVEPSFDRLADFLQRRCRTLGSIAANESQSTQSTPGAQPGKGCPACKEAHYIGHCLTFRGLDPHERRRMVTERGLCYNCLSSNHPAKNCPSLSTCRSYSGTHHTLIHEATNKRPGSAEGSEQEHDPKRPRLQVTATKTVSKLTPSGDSDWISILPTAIASMIDGESRKKTVRVLLDPCSEATLVTLSLARKLNCKLRRINIGITGVSGSIMGSACHQTTLCMLDPTTERPKTIDAFVLRSIDIVTPSRRPEADLALIKRSFPLADSNFDEPQRVEVVLGADTYAAVFTSGIQHRGSLLLQNTIFGWTVTGRATGSAVEPFSTYVCTIAPRSDDELCHEQLLGLVQRFWATEELPQVHRVSSEDLECERTYAENCSRDDEGRYIVPLPLRLEVVALLGESLPQAQAALSSMHRRMSKDLELKDSYCQFMTDYELLGHMRRLSPEENSDASHAVHYIPHHGIWQRSDEGRKLRVVFNASRPTDSGYSLNDALRPGLKLQSHITDIITRWRQHRLVFCADVRMMFRQIRIRSQDTHLQRILWSPSAKDPVNHYVLLTVTYGEACAPYLALRTLKQLCTDEGANFPLAVEAVEQALYMDDFLVGSHDLAYAKSLQRQLVGLLKAGGMQLRKWVANDPALLTDIPAEHRLRPDWVSFSTGGPVSELGVSWDPVSDCFQFRSPFTSEISTLTKREALAELARIFDPEGWLAPAVLVAKLVIQDLWRAKLDWDKSLPRSWVEKWLLFRRSMQDIAKVSIPRWFGCTPESGVQLHAFSDASRRAMAGVVYSRTEIDGQDARTLLIGAKTKLASIKSLTPPSKPSIRATIPRLELRAALIAARLLRSYAAALDIPISSCHLWTDSQIVLHWLRTDGPVGNDIVDNYTSHIQELTEGATWHHVPTRCNPADIASRGADAAKLISHAMWWSGPDWLAECETKWPSDDDNVETASREKSSSAMQVLPLSTVSCASTTLGITEQPSANHIERFSSLNSLLRATARSARLFQRKRGLHTVRTPLSPVTADELFQAYLVSVRLDQTQTFATEIEHIRRHGVLRGQSPLTSLEPFLDDQGILRVGGRLSRAALPYNERHPVLLQGQSHLAQLVVRWAHDRSLHGGFRATYAQVLKRAWITGGKIRVKGYLRHCVQMWGRLCRTLFHLSVCWKRHVNLQRIYGTLRLHEHQGHSFGACGDLTTASFLGAFTRFISRRGKPLELWSDNGTNFHGADLELQRKLREAEIEWELIEGHLAKEGILWKFIPPGAPHFGGLWEAGVKSMKAHLNRVVGPRRLTYEEFYTLLVSVEMILNSRPLVPPTGDLDDIDALTPSHFLIGSSVYSPPQPISSEAQLDRATHWQLVKAMRDSFWERWSREYLNTLIQRPKWKSPQPNLEVGDFVVVVDPSLLRPDGRWPMGRIVNVHPGKDGLVRTATVKTATGQYLRPVVKLARLPLRDERVLNSESSTAGGHE